MQPHDEKTARLTALKNEQPTYSGKPCPTCQGIERYASNRACVPCSRAATRANYDRDKARTIKRAQRLRAKAARLGADLLAGL